ncbi:MAG: ribosome recycling factor [Patescibacteria group bacterium]
MAYDFKPFDAQVKETEEWLVRELSTIRTGRATPIILDGVKPEVYGARTPLMQVASVTIEDARTLRIVPWDKSIMKNIEKAIVDADLGVGVGTDDQGLRISFPELTADRRTMLGKIAGEKTEQARVTLRGHRADVLKALDSAEKEGGMSQDELKRYKDEVQKKIDAGVAALEELLDKKKKEITL